MPPISILSSQAIEKYSNVGYDNRVRFWKRSCWKIIVLLIIFINVTRTLLQTRLSLHDKVVYSGFEQKITVDKLSIVDCMLGIRYYLKLYTRTETSEKYETVLVLFTTLNIICCFLYPDINSFSFSCLNNPSY
ncbi:hypothetical protein QTP88_004845 [Uroleucon formosanum]